MTTVTAEMAILGTLRAMEENVPAGAFASVVKHMAGVDVATVVGKARFELPLEQTSGPDNPLWLADLLALEDNPEFQQALDRLNQKHVGWVLSIGVAFDPDSDARLMAEVRKEYLAKGPTIPNIPCVPVFVIDYHSAASKH